MPASPPAASWKCMNVNDTPNCVQVCDTGLAFVLKDGKAAASDREQPVCPWITRWFATRYIWCHLSLPLISPFSFGALFSVNCVLLTQGCRELTPLMDGWMDGSPEKECRKDIWTEKSCRTLFLMYYYKSVAFTVIFEKRRRREHQMCSQAMHEQYMARYMRGCTLLLFLANVIFSSFSLLCFLLYISWKILMCASLVSKGTFLFLSLSNLSPPADSQGRGRSMLHPFYLIKW